ncbi:hypothetical protein BU17DRAFT_100700 [Hysterangium stoloniferum]|nr:hypothetical protein BU17DRAFT_100700 [Hysterangium stoloniferum]
MLILAPAIVYMLVVTVSHFIYSRLPGMIVILTLLPSQIHATFTTNLTAYITNRINIVAQYFLWRVLSRFTLERKLDLLDMLTNMSMSLGYQLPIFDQNPTFPAKFLTKFMVRWMSDVTPSHVMKALGWLPQRNVIRTLNLACYTDSMMGESILKMLIKKKYLRENPEGRKHVVFLPEETFYHVRQTICPELERQHAAVVGDAFLVFMLLVIAFTLINFTIYFLFSHFQTRNVARECAASPAHNHAVNKVEETDERLQTLPTDVPNGTAPNIVANPQMIPAPSPNTESPASTSSGSTITVHANVTDTTSAVDDSNAAADPDHLTPTTPRKDKGKAVDRGNYGPLAVPTVQDDSEDDDTSSTTDSDAHDGGSSHTILGQNQAISNPHVIPQPSASVPTTEVTDYDPNRSQHMSPEYFRTQWMTPPRRDFAYRLTPSKETNEWRNIHSTISEQQEPSERYEPAEQHDPVNDDHFTTGETVSLAQSTQSDMASDMSVTAPLPAVPSGSPVASAGTAVVNDQGIDQPEYAQAESVPADGPVNVDGYRTLTQDEIGWRVHAIAIQRTQATAAPSPGTTPRYFDSEEAIGIVKYCNSSNYFGTTLPPRNLPESMGTVDDRLQSIAADILLGLVESSYADCIPQIVKYVELGFAMTWVGHREMPPLVELTEKQQAAINVWKPTVPTPCCFPVNWVPGTFQVPVELYSPDFGIFDMCICLVISVTDRESYAYFPAIAALLYAAFGDPNDPVSKQVISDGALGQQLRDCLAQRKGRYLDNTAQGVNAHDLNQDLGAPVAGPSTDPFSTDGLYYPAPAAVGYSNDGSSSSVYPGEDASQLAPGPEFQPEQNIGHETWNVDNGYASSQGQILGYAEPPRESQIPGYPESLREAEPETEDLFRDTVRGEEHSEGGAVGTESTPGGSKKKNKKKKKMKTIANGDPVEILQYIDPAITVQPPEDDTESVPTPRKSHPLPAERKGQRQRWRTGNARHRVRRGIRARASCKFPASEHRNRGTTVSASSPGTSTIVPTHDRMVVLQATFRTSSRRQDQVTNSDSVGLSWLGPRPPAANSVSVLPRTVSVSTGKIWHIATLNSAPTNGLVVHRQHSSGSVPRGTATSPSETLTTHAVLTKQTFKFSDVLEVNDLTPARSFIFLLIFLASFSFCLDVLIV